MLFLQRTLLTAATSAILLGLLAPLQSARAGSVPAGLGVDGSSAAFTGPVVPGNTTGGAGSNAFGGFGDGSTEQINTPSGPLGITASGGNSGGVQANAGGALNQNVVDGIAGALLGNDGEADEEDEE